MSSFWESAPSTGASGGSGAAPALQPAASAFTVADPVALLSSLPPLPATSADADAYTIAGSAKHHRSASAATSAATGASTSGVFPPIPMSPRTGTTTLNAGSGSTNGGGANGLPLVGGSPKSKRVSIVTSANTVVTSALTPTSVRISSVDGAQLRSELEYKQLQRIEQNNKSKTRRTSPKAKQPGAAVAVVGSVATTVRTSAPPQPASASAKPAPARPLKFRSAAAAPKTGVITATTVRVPAPPQPAASATTTGNSSTGGGASAALLDTKHSGPEEAVASGATTETVSVNTTTAKGVVPRKPKLTPAEEVAERKRAEAARRKQLRSSITTTIRSTEPAVASTPKNAAPPAATTQPPAPATNGTTTAPSAAVVVPLVSAAPVAAAPVVAPAPTVAAPAVSAAKPTAPVSNGAGASHPPAASSGGMVWTDEPLVLSHGESFAPIEPPPISQQFLAPYLELTSQYRVHAEERARVLTHRRERSEVNRARAHRRAEKRRVKEEKERQRVAARRARERAERAAAARADDPIVTAAEIELKVNEWIRTARQRQQHAAMTGTASSTGSGSGVTSQVSPSYNPTVMPVSMPPPFVSTSPPARAASFKSSASFDAASSPPAAVSPLSARYGSPRGGAGHNSPAKESATAASVPYPVSAAVATYFRLQRQFQAAQAESAALQHGHHHPPSPPAANHTNHTALIASEDVKRSSPPRGAANASANGVALLSPAAAATYQALTDEPAPRSFSSGAVQYAHDQRHHVPHSPLQFQPLPQSTYTGVGASSGGGSPSAAGKPQSGGAFTAAPAPAPAPTNQRPPSAGHEPRAPSRGGGGSRPASRTARAAAAAGGGVGTPAAVAQSTYRNVPYTVSQFTPAVPRAAAGSLENVVTPHYPPRRHSRSSSTRSAASTSTPGLATTKRRRRGGKRSPNKPRAHPMMASPSTYAAGAASAFASHPHHATANGGAAVAAAAFVPPAALPFVGVTSKPTYTDAAFIPFDPNRYLAEKQHNAIRTQYSHRRTFLPPRAKTFLSDQQRSAAPPNALILDAARSFMERMSAAVEAQSIHSARN